MRPPSLLLIPALATSGCIYPQLRAGPAWSLSRPEEAPVVSATGAVDIIGGPQGPVELTRGVVIQTWTLDQPAAYGYGYSLRAKAGSHLGQLAAGMHLSGHLKIARPVWVGTRVGLHLLQLDVVDRQFGAGIGSPYVETHLGVRVGDELTLVVSPWWEHDLRFGPAPDETFAGVSLGLSFFPIP